MKRLMPLDTRVRWNERTLLPEAAAIIGNVEPELHLPAWRAAV